MTQTQLSAQRRAHDDHKLLGTADVTVESAPVFMNRSSGTTDAVSTLRNKAVSGVASPLGGCGVACGGGTCGVRVRVKG